jgi:hypothetical protein
VWLVSGILEKIQGFLDFARNDAVVEAMNLSGLKRF